MIVKEQFHRVHALLRPEGVRMAVAQGLYQKRQGGHGGEAVIVQIPGVQDKPVVFQGGTARPDAGADAGNALRRQDGDALQPVLQGVAKLELGGPVRVGGGESGGKAEAVLLLKLLGKALVALQGRVAAGAEQQSKQQGDEGKGFFHEYLQNG